MTTEDKELLLKDLCARLPYKFTVHRYCDNVDISIDGIDDFAHFLEYSEGEDFKPYLRPMSSMTESERNEYLDIKMQECERVALAEVYRPEAISIIFGWLNSHHFDYRGLIEKGLALPAPPDMYK